MEPLNRCVAFCFLSTQRKKNSTFARFWHCTSWELKVKKGDVGRTRVERERRDGGRRREGAMGLIRREGERGIEGGKGKNGRC
jgi:hypothetical protein